MKLVHLLENRNDLDEVRDHLWIKAITDLTVLGKSATEARQKAYEMAGLQVPTKFIKRDAIVKMAREKFPSTDPKSTGSYQSTLWQSELYDRAGTLIGVESAKIGFRVFEIIGNLVRGAGTVVHSFGDYQSVVVFDDLMLGRENIVSTCNNRDLMPLNKVLNAIHPSAATL